MGVIERNLGKFSEHEQDAQYRAIKLHDDPDSCPDPENSTGLEHSEIDTAPSEYLLDLGTDAYLKCLEEPKPFKGCSVVMHTAGGKTIFNLRHKEFLEGVGDLKRFAMKGSPNAFSITKASPNSLAVLYNLRL